MKRTVNNTGRKRIEFADFEISVFPNLNDVGHLAKINWKLDYLGLNPRADVVVAISGRGLDRRFEFGELGSGTGQGAFQIGETEESPALRIQIWVSEWSEDKTIRRILASSASRAIVTGEIPNGSQSILPVKLVSDLLTLWSLDYSTGTPILLVSNKVPGAVHAAWFRVGVLPQVISALYRKLVVDFEDLDSEVLETWEGYFSELGLAVDELRDALDFDHFQISDSVNISEAAEEAAALFTQKFDLLSAAALATQGEE